MNLQQLYHFRAVAELEHYSKAADRLMITQPSISHSVNELEKELGVSLLNRQGRNVKLTKYGKLFLEYVTESLDALEEGKLKLQEYTQPNTGTVSLSYFTSLNEFVVDLVTRYFAGNIQLKTKFLFHQIPSFTIESNLQNGTTDLALSTKLNDSLHSFKVGEHKVALIVRKDHPLADRHSVDLSQLGNESFIIYDLQSQLGQYLVNVFRHVGISPVIAAETNQDTALISMVTAGFGIALMPEPLTPLHGNNTRVLKIENQLPQREIFLMWKDVRHMSPAVMHFRDFVVKNGLVLDSFLASLAEQE